MSEEEPQFLTVGSGKSARRIAWRRSVAEHSRPPGVVWMSGLRSDMLGTKANAVAEWAERSGQSCLRFDYSGHGESGGRFEDGTVGQWLEESVAAISGLTQGPQILIGSSMGGWLALLILRGLARKQITLGRASVAAAVLIAPAWDMTEELMLKEMSPEARLVLMTNGVWLRPSQYGEEPYPITHHLIEEGRHHLIGGGTFNPGVPVHVLQGLKDADVPWRHAAALERKLEGDWLTTYFIDEGDHRLSRPKDIDRLLAVLEELSDKTRERR